MLTASLVNADRVLLAFAWLTPTYTLAVCCSFLDSMHVTRTVKEPNMAMNKENVFSMILGLALAVAGTPAGAAADADSLQQVVERGKDLFMTATFEGNGRHCNTCHKGGGTAMSELPDGKKFASLSNAAAIFPRYDEEHHRVKTLHDQVQHCARTALKGKPPAYDSPEMTELVTYLTSLSQGKPVDMGGKPQ